MLLTEDILHDFRSGHLRSFYQAAYPSLLSYAERLLGEADAWLAEDCVQDTILHTYEQRRNLHTPQQLKALLYTALHNACVSQLRRGQSRRNYLNQEAPAGEDLLPSLEQTLLEQETMDTLFRLIDDLPQRLRRIFDLSFEQGLRNQEVARQIGLSLSAVKKQKQDLLRHLRTQLKKGKPMQ